MNALFRVLRFILSPIADSNWFMKIDQRCFHSCLTPVDFLPMPAEGPLTLGGDLFAPIQFHPDGAVRVADKLYPRGMNFDEPIGNKARMSRAGELVLILQNDMPPSALTYEQGAWLQWRYAPPTLSQALHAEYRLNRELGARTVYAVFIASSVAFFGLFVVTFLYSYFGFDRPQ
jgi:hypothetical protein